MELAVHTSKPNDRRQELFELAVQQAGFFTAGQARELGYSNRLMHHHKSKGNWEEHGWGLYRLKYFPHSPDEDLVRLTLWSRNKAGEPQAVVSHDTALRHFELSDVLPDKYHLTVPVGFRKNALPEVILHYGELESKDIQQREGFSVTTPLRTLLDFARDQSPFNLPEFTLALLQALDRGFVRKEKLLERLEDFPVVYQKVMKDKL